MKRPYFENIKGFSLIEFVMTIAVTSIIIIFSTGLFALIDTNYIKSEKSNLEDIRNEIYFNFTNKKNCDATFKTLADWQKRPNSSGTIFISTIIDEDGNTLYDNNITEIQEYTFNQIEIKNFRLLTEGSKNSNFLADFHVVLKKGTEVLSDVEPNTIIVKGPLGGGVTPSRVYGCGTYRQRYWELSDTTNGYFTDFNASIGHNGAPAEKVDISGPARLTSNPNNGLLVEMRESPINHVFFGLQNPGQLTISNSENIDLFNIYSNNNVTLGANDYNSAKLELVDTLNSSTGVLALSNGWNENYSFFLDTNSLSGDNLSLIKTNGTSGNIVVESSLHIGDNNGLAGGYRFYVNGTAGGTTAWQVISDRRLKRDIVEINDNNILSKLLKLNGYYFKWKNTNKKDFGVIAQEVQKQFPELVYTSNEGTLYVKKDLLALYLSKALVQINREQDKLNKEINHLVNEVCTLNPKEKICL